jgi:pyrroloquinoline-quinone synthase
MSQEEFWTRIYSLLHKYDLLRHPFYEAWAKGELTLYDLREYASEYYHHVAFSPVYLSEFGERLPDGELRKAVIDNLRDELGMSSDGGRAYNLLWLDFAVGTGALPNDVFNRKPIIEVNALIETFLMLARNAEPPEALAAFYVYESQLPRVAKEIAKALRMMYGLDEGACKYFTLHATADAGHATVWCRQLQESLHGDAKAANQAIAAAERTAKALWRALDGINAKRGLKSSRPKAHLN